MEEMAPQAGIHLMPVTDIGPETAILIKEKLDRGEWVAIVGDRIAVTPQRGGSWRVIWSAFMGQPAPFPQGAVYPGLHSALSGGADFCPQPAGDADPAL